MTKGGVVATLVIKQREATNGNLPCPSGVELQRCSTNCSIVIGGIKDQRPSATTCDGGGGRLGRERLPTNRRIECVSGLTKKGVKPFRGVASIHSIRRRRYVRSIRSCPHLWQKHEAGKH